MSTYKVDLPHFLTNQLNDVRDVINSKKYIQCNLTTMDLGRVGNLSKMEYFLM